MAWKVVERRIGRAGGIRQRNERQRIWDQKYGEDNWQIGYVIDGRFVSQEEALESIYYQSYADHFANHSGDLQELIGIAKTLRNPHAQATTSVDLQVPAITSYLARHGLKLAGKEVVDIGSWEGQASHPISIRLSPLHIHVTGDAKMTLENFWQSRKCLAIWEEGDS